MKWIPSGDTTMPPPLGGNNKVTAWTFYSLGGYSQCLHMCKLYYIRKRKRTTCTYAAAGPEQLLQIKKHLPASPKNVRIPVKQNIFLQVRVNAALFLFWFIFQNISFQISCFTSHKFKKQETVLYKVKLLARGDCLEYRGISIQPDKGFLPSPVLNCGGYYSGN